MKEVIFMTGATGFLGTEAERETLHSPLLPENLYVADATILPEAMGNPPILTIIALAKKISKTLKQSQDPGRL